MSTILALKLAHLLAFVYWLGGDLGTFYSSRFVVDDKLSPAQRATALKIMLGCDQGPKLAMPLIFALGFSLATQMGYFSAPAAVSAAVWLLALAWFANVNYLFFTANEAAKARLSQIDLWFRVLVVLLLAGLALATLAGTGPFGPGWLALKILIFAALVACGIWIRIQLRPFGAAFGRLLAEGSSPEVESTLNRSIARCRPAVYLIWLGLIANAALGLHLISA